MNISNPVIRIFVREAYVLIQTILALIKNSLNKKESSEELLLWDILLNTCCKNLVKLPGNCLCSSPYLSNFTSCRPSTLLTHFSPVSHFYTPWRRQGYRNVTLDWNGSKHTSKIIKAGIFQENCVQLLLPITQQPNLFISYLTFSSMFPMTHLAK